VSTRLSAHLVKRLPGFALDVELEVGAGITVLFGPSGAGKSLTLRMLAGLLPPDDGHVTLDGLDLYRGTAPRLALPPQRRHLGVVFQNHSLFPHMTVRQNIAFGARTLTNAERDERVAGLVKQFRLEGLEDRSPAHISGGQRQRVALARAIVGRPRALLLDEPFSSLDHPMRIVLRECLGEAMRHLDVPVLLVTHDLEEACALADTMLVLAAGRVVQQGTPQQVITRPLNETVAALVRRPAADGDGGVERTAAWSR